MKTVIKFFDWLLYGYISDLEIQLKMYKEKLPEVIRENQKLRAEKRHFEDLSHKLRLKIDIHEEKCFERQCQLRKRKG
jgi:hypothetical protein